MSPTEKRARPAGGAASRSPRPGRAAGKSPTDAQLARDVGRPGPIAVDAAGLGLLKELLDSTADHIHVKDLDGRYVLVNAADAAGFARLPAEMIGLTDSDLLGPERAAAAIAHDRAVVESGEAIEYQQEETVDRLVRTWQTTKNVLRDPAGRVNGIFTISHDITEQRRQEAGQRQAAKMEAVGQLAGGVAHDFNNMLTAIRGYAELVRDHLPAEQLDDRADLDEIITAADRAAELTRQLLAFSRRQVLAPRILDPGEAVLAIAPMLRRLLGERIELSIRTAPGLGQVRVDPAQLDQVILNLAVNSRDAMPDGGQLSIETAIAELDDGYAETHPGAHAGAHVQLAVSDTGTGMDAGTRERLFEPFFTTKEVGQGTGMGLATVYGIVKQSGASIDVYSEPGYGTTFRIYFPLVLDATGPVVGHAAPSVVPTGHETILLAEDEPAVRGFAARAMRGLGYNVLESPNGREALALAAAHGGRIDLLVTDVIMPGIHGSELSEQLTAVRPDIRTLYVSGFPEDSFVRQAVLGGDLAYLSKPFSAASLGRAVRATLDSARAETPIE